MSEGSKTTISKGPVSLPKLTQDLFLYLPAPPHTYIMAAILTTIHQSPCGELIIGATEGRICLCDWAAGCSPRPVVERRLRRIYGPLTDLGPATSPILDEALRQLDLYFSGLLRRFDLPLAIGGTPLQQAVWRRLQTIPYASTLSYSQLAASIGRPTAVRAVASACGANAISIIIPCHRVTGADGSLTGYAGGLHAKRRLLALESHAATPMP